MDNRCSHGRSVFAFCNDCEWDIHQADKQKHQPANPSIEQSKYHALANQLADLLHEKEAAYGSAWRKTGDYLRLLFPYGISCDKYEDVALLVRCFDKLMRIATHREALEEDPWKDLAGYGLLGSSRKD